MRAVRTGTAFVRRFAQDCTVLGFRLAWGGVRRLPAPAAYRLFDALAGVTHRRDGRSVQRLRANYARVRPELAPPELEALVREGVRSYLRYWCEAFRLPERSVADLVDGVRVEGDGPVRECLAQGRSVVCFLGHLGNWDTAGAWSTTQLHPVTTVAERLEPEELFLEFLHFRERLGMRIIPLTGGGDVFRQLMVDARGTTLIPLLADRDLTSRGVEVDFCGHRARMAVGPAALAVSTDAALFPVSITYERDPRGRARGGYRVLIRFHDRVPVPEGGTTREKTTAMTQACADALGATVRTHTQDWHMMQRVFVDDLDPGYRG